MGYTIIEYALSVADSAINIIFLEKMFGYKENKKRNRYVFMGLYFLVSHYLMAYLMPQMLCLILVELMYCITSLKGKRYEHIIWTVALNVIYCTISSVILPVLSMITGEAAAELIVAGSIERIWMVLIQKFIICIALWCVLSYLGKQLNLMFMEKLIVVILLVTNIFIVSGFYVISVKTSIDTAGKIGFFVISVLIVIVLVVCAALMVMISSKNKQMLGNHMLKFQLESQSNMIDHMRKNNQEIRILRHDLKHYALIIQNLLKNNDVEKALVEVGKYIEKTILVEQQTDYIKGNQSINAVMYYYMCECEKKNIDFNIRVTTNYTEDVEQDMAILFANLLDNAVRAEEKVEKDKRCIDVNIYEEDKMFTAVISNYIEQSVLSDNPELRTTKLDDKLHGWGIKSVKNIVEKRNGIVRISEQDNTFNVIVEIPMVV